MFCHVRDGGREEGGREGHILKVYRNRVLEVIFVVNMTEELSKGSKFQALRVYNCGNIR
jgi:hypothetical protein